MPVPAEHSGSVRQLREYYHDRAFSGADIDLFLYGLTPEQAEKKV